MGELLLTLLLMSHVSVDNVSYLGGWTAVSWLGTKMVSRRENHLMPLTSVGPCTLGWHVHGTDHLSVNYKHSTS